MDRNEQSINWEKWGVIVAIIFGLLGLFGISFNCNSCNGFTSCSGYSSSDSVEEDKNLNKSSSEDKVLTDEEIKKEIQEKTGKVWIEDVHVMYSHTERGGDYSFVDTDMYNTGEDCTHGFLIRTEILFVEKGKGQDIQFFLDSQYDTFSAKIGVPESTSSEVYASMDLLIYVDDNLAYKKTLTPDSFPEDVNIDCKGAQTIKFCTLVHDKFKGKSSAFYYAVSYYVLIGNAYFTISR